MQDCCSMYELENGVFFPAFFTVSLRNFASQVQRFVHKAPRYAYFNTFSFFERDVDFRR